MTYFNLNTSLARTLLVILIVHTLVSVTNLTAMLCCVSSPEKEFLAECKNISRDLKPDARLLCDAITTSDVDSVNQLIDLDAPVLLRNTLVTKPIHHHLLTILNATYPDLKESNNPRVWQYQETQKYPALKIVVTLLNYLSHFYEDYARTDTNQKQIFPSTIDHIAMTAYERILILCRKSKTVPQDLSHCVFEAMEKLEGIAVQQAKIFSGQQSGQQSVATHQDIQVCTPRGCVPAALARERFQESTISSQDDDEKENEEYQEEEYSGEIRDSGPQISGLFLIERGRIFQEFKHLPS